MRRRTFLQSPLSASTVGASLLLPGLLGSAATAHAQLDGHTPVEHVPYPNSVEVAGQTLVLNGAGVRHRAIFKMYALALYMVRRTSDPLELYAMPGPKQLRMVALREIDSNVLGQLMNKGMADNNDRATTLRMLPEISQLAQYFAQTSNALRKAGDTITLTFLPRRGTLVNVKGQDLGQLHDPDFFNALINIWIGPRPADERLKKQLLGLTLTR